MKQVVYLSYDLGFQGDYFGLYKWLDAHQALECGDSYCRFKYDFKSVGDDITTEEETRLMVQEIRKDLLSAIQFSSTDRVYMTSVFFVKGKKRMSGLFLIGKRKQTNPWDGAAGGAELQQVIDE